MEPIIEKFIKYLDERRLFLMNNMVTDKNFNKFHPSLIDKLEVLVNSNSAIEMHTFSNLKLFFKLEKDRDGILFKDFSLLSKLVFQSGLSEDECVFVIFYLIKQNFNNYILNAELVNTIDISLIRADDFQTLSESDLTEEKILYNNLRKKDGATRNTALEWTKEQLEEFEEVKKKYVTDISDVKDAHYTIKENYFDKKKNFDEDDIKIIMRAFENLGIIKPILIMIETNLRDELHYRIQKNKYKTSQKKAVVGFNKDLIPNNKNYNKIVKQLNDVVDFREMMPKGYLSLNQVVECVSSMMKTGVTQEDIRKFLWNTEIFNQNRELHTITKYLELYEKLKYYENKLVLFDELKNMEEYFKALFIASDEEYVFWKDCLEEELNNYLKQIPGGYMYEIDMARKRVK